MKPNTLQTINQLTSQINDSLVEHGEAFIELSGHDEYFHEAYCLKPENIEMRAGAFIYHIAGKTIEMDNILHIRIPEGIDCEQDDE